MPQPKKGLNIRFEGKLVNLVINYEGKVLYSYKREQIKKREKTEKERANQARTRLVNAFCSQINQINALRWAWRNRPKRGRSPYRNMISANMKIAREHLLQINSIIPQGNLFWGAINKSLTTERFSFNSPAFAKEAGTTLEKKTASIVTIFYLYDPLKAKKSAFNFFTKTMEQPDYDIYKGYDINLEFTPAEQKELKAYKTGIVYIALVLSELKGQPKQWGSDSLLWER